MRSVLPLVLLPVLAACSADPRVEAEPPLPACEWCGAQDAPEDLTWRATLAPEGEPGEPLVMTGRVVDEAGRAVPDVLVYAYHTNAEGIYPRRGDETGNGRRHGYLRGWVRTDERGRYRFETIRPAPYPCRDDPAHIHITLTPRGGEERWVDSTWFAGDPRITGAQHTRRRGNGSIVTLERDDDAVWHARRDLVLAER